MKYQKQISNKVFLECKLLYSEIKSKEPAIEKITNPDLKQLDFNNETPSTNPDLIVFNNSFMYRDKLKTNKSDSYLGLLRTPPESEEDLVIVYPDYKINSDWKYISSKSNNYPKIKPLSSNIEEFILDIGEIIFILIGNFGELTRPIVQISIDNLKNFSIDASIDTLEIQNSSIIANPQKDDLSLWERFQEEFQIADSKMEKYRLEFFNKLEELRNNINLPLLRPNNKSDLENTFLDAVFSTLQKEINEYEKSLYEWQKNNKDQANYNNILRISYNFSDDAIKLLRLIISISDLKSLLFWMTIFSQYKLKDEFDKLSWETVTKPSLNEYDVLIKGARNSRFHNLFNVNNTVTVDLEGINLRAIKLTLFNEYAGRNQMTNNFDYEDKQLIDVLKEFTRTSEKTVSEVFWSQNLEIMKATNKLIEEISESLKLLKYSTWQI